MSYSLQNTTSLTSLADAIRSKTGDSASMTVEEMITAVNSITTGGGSSSSSGWIKRKKYKTTSALTITHGTYLDVDTELAQDKEFIFLLTTQNKSAASSEPAKNAILLFYDGSSLVSQYICASLAFNLTFAVNYDSTNQVNKLRITNNETQYDLDLRSSGYSENGEKVWGNLFYLDESFNEIQTINVPQLYYWNYGGQSDNIIDAIFDKLTFNLSGDQGTNMSGAFQDSNLGQTTDWSSKSISQVNGVSSGVYNFGSMFMNNVVIKYPPKFNFTNANNGCRFLYQFYHTFEGSAVVKISSDTFPQDARIYNANTNQMFNGCYHLREVPEDFLGYAAYNTVTTPTNNTRALTSAMYNNCKVLKELKGAPVLPCSDSACNKDLYGVFVTNCWSLHNLTFYKYQNDVVTQNAYNQTIDLSTVGYWTMGAYDDPNASINVCLEPEDQANKIIISASTNNATAANVENLNSFGINLAYSTYTRKSAVATINSLPDTHLAITNNGGTNTIKFASGAGSAYGNDYDMSQLSAAEIAVATAKGWTVVLV